MEIPATRNSGFLEMMEELLNNIKNPAQHLSAVEDDFEKNYYRIRLREGWIYDDDSVTKLPFIDKNDVHFTKWRLRQQSTRRLLNYLKKKRRPLEILEVGCGNGWLSHQLASIPHSVVTGIDIHKWELSTAKRVFASSRNLEFQLLDFSSSAFQKNFDIIVFAASAQYFPTLSALFEKAFDHLFPDGEIHVIDTPFYTDDEISFATSRSEAHFRKMNVPDMATHYYHHLWSDLDNYSPHFLYKPSALLGKLRISQNPFPWICIKNLK